MHSGKVSRCQLLMLNYMWQSSTFCGLPHSDSVFVMVQFYPENLRELNHNCARVR